MQKKNTTGFQTFDLHDAAEQIIKKHYKSPDSARKIRKFLAHIDAAFTKHFEHQAIPEHVRKEAALVTLYGLAPQEIRTALLEHSNSPRFIDEPDNAYRNLHEELGKMNDIDVLPFLHALRARLGLVWEAAQFKAFSFDELTTKKNWSWRLKIAIHQEMKKVHHTYDVRLVLCPKDHWRSITTLEEEIHELMTDPQLAMDIDGDRKAKIEDRQKRIAERQAAWNTRLQACPDLQFEGTVKQVDYRDVKIEDDDGESMTIPGTVLTLRIPGRTVEELNAIREAIDDYHIRLQPV